MRSSPNSKGEPPSVIESAPEPHFSADSHNPAKRRRGAARSSSDGSLRHRLILLASLHCCIDARYFARMPSIGFLAQKGGAGKTTLAVHLAVLAGDGLLVDLDPQRSSAEWWDTRSADLPEL